MRARLSEKWLCPLILVYVNNNVTCHIPCVLFYVLASHSMLTRQCIPFVEAEVRVLQVKFEDIGGLLDLKNALIETVLMPLSHPELYAK